MYIHIYIIYTQCYISKISDPTTRLTPYLTVMACNRPELDNLKELLTCPVCFNTFNNPRHLGCGHQFCEECLRSIADRHVDGDVICPTCRVLTVVHGDVTSLPRAVLTSQIQETVEYLPHKQKQTPTKKRKRLLTCEEAKCSEVATKRCMKCGRNACDKCINKHDRLKHKTVVIKEELFCSTHVKDVVTFYCEDCKVGVCEFCLLEDHEGHHTEDIENKAEEVRGKLQNVIKDVESIDREYKIIESNIRSNLVENARNEKKFQDKAAKYVKILRDAVKIIEETSEDCLERMRGIKKKLKDLSTQNTNLRTVKRNLIDSSKKLIEEKTEGVVTRLSKGEALHKQYLKTETFHDNIRTGDTNYCTGGFEVLERVVEKCVSALQTRDSKSYVKTDKTVIKQRKPKSCSIGISTEFIPKVTMVTVAQQTENQTSTDSMATENQLHIHTITKVKELDTEYLNGLLIDKQDHRIVVRNNSLSEKPLVTFDYHGNQMSATGYRIGFVDRTIRSMALDTKRGLYLLPRMDKLYRVDRSGQETGTFQIKGNTSIDLFGVTYLSVEDLYVVTDIENDEIIILDPNTKQEVKRLKGEGRSTFDSPESVTVYIDRIDNKSVIVVSDTVNNRVVEMDLHGQFIRQYGKTGNMAKRFCETIGVCVDDNRNRVFVCDHGNHRIMSCLHASNGQVQKTCLLTKEQLGGDRPFHIDYDSDSGLLVVSTFKYDVGESKWFNGKLHIYSLPVHIHKRRYRRV